MSLTRKINKIIIHCSDSSFGNAALIKKWHTLPKIPPHVTEGIKNRTLKKSEAYKYGRGWSDVGYHFMILNGKTEPGVKYDPIFDGVIEEGRPLDVIGAHCAGENQHSIGICIIGTHLFTGKHISELLSLLKSLLDSLGLTPDDVYGHCEFSSKPCPNIDPNIIRDMLKGIINKKF